MEYTEMDRERYIRGIEGDIHKIEADLKDITRSLERIK